MTFVHVCFFLFAEEKRTGKSKPKKEYGIHIPQKNDPFDKDKISEKSLSGDNIFVKNEDNCSSPHSPKESAWMTESEQGIMDTTCGFEDNFVEVWGQVKDTAKVKEKWGMLSQESTDSIFDDEDPIFRTISGW